MCFTIHSNTPPGNTKAYKIVSGENRGSQYRYSGKDIIYKDGKIIRALGTPYANRKKGLKKPKFVKKIGRASESGIYVFLRRPSRYDLATGDVVIEVEVKDKDFIAFSKNYGCPIATYMKVKVIGRVPHA